MRRLRTNPPGWSEGSRTTERAGSGIAIWSFRSRWIASLPYPSLMQSSRRLESRPSTVKRTKQTRKRNSRTKSGKKKLVLVEAANEAMEGWVSQLETLTLEARSNSGRGDRCTEFAVNVAIQLDPLTAWAVGDFAPLFSRLTGLPLAESDQPILMQEYSLNERASSTVTGLDGWVGPLWHWAHDFEGIIHQYFGIRPSFFALLGRIQRDLKCATYEGGTIVEDRYEGEAVWVVTCPTDVDSVMPFVGGYFNDDYALTTARVTISQANGAPLLSEYRRAVRYDDGSIGKGSTRIVLTSWNEPIDFPTPEPYVEYTEYEQLLERLRVQAQQLPSGTDRSLGRTLAGCDWTTDRMVSSNLQLDDGRR